MSELTDLLRERAASALPPVEGEFRVAGLREPVHVRWDRWGVPHIAAGSLHDLFFAQGYVMASERLFQVDLTTRLGTGRLSEAFGETTLPLDRFIRTVGWNRTARAMVGRLDERTLEMGEATMAGVRAWIERMPARPIEYDILQLDPFVPAGTDGMERVMGAATLLAWSLSANWDAELLRAEIAARFGWETVATLFPGTLGEAATVVAGKQGGTGGRRSALDLLREAPPLPRGQGSNNWVVSGARTASGMPLLANDPHLLVQLPSVWYEVHLSAPGYHVQGVTLPYAPGVVIGRNERIAWGITALAGDTQDLYLERLSEDGTAARYRAAWEPLTVHREEIAVRGRPEPEILEVRETRHGPLLDAYLLGVRDPQPVPGGIRETYALRWVASEGVVTSSVLYALNTASTFEEFRAALSRWDLPDLNFVYADVEGNIGYQAVGRFPVRRGSDGTVPVPGWTGEHEWDGWISFEQLPWAYNPEEGLLATANNQIHDDSYPYVISRDFQPPFRARRIVELLTGRARHDRESFARMQTDTVSLPAREIVPHLVRVEPADDRQKQALALLGEWDLDLAAGSAAAALFEVWCCRTSEAILREKLGEELFQHFHGRRQWSLSFQWQVLPTLLANPTSAWFGANGAEARDDLLRRALDEALDELAAAMGPEPDGWAWGKLHRVRFAGRLAMVPDLRELFTAGEVPLGGDDATVAQALYEPGGRDYGVAVIPSWRQIVDLGDPDASVGIHAPGQSGNPASPHFADLLPLWSSGRLHPLPFTEAAVEAATVTTMELVPAEEGDPSR